MYHHSINDRHVRKNLKDVKKELSEISMMDEFAQYAKTERKINKVHCTENNGTDKHSTLLTAHTTQYTHSTHYTLDHFINNDDSTIFWRHTILGSLGQY